MMFWVFMSAQLKGVSTKKPKQEMLRSDQHLQHNKSMAKGTQAPTGPEKKKLVIAASSSLSWRGEKCSTKT
jgi:hypothetical protein